MRITTGINEGDVFFYDGKVCICVMVNDCRAHCVAMQHVGVTIGGRSFNATQTKEYDLSPNSHVHLVENDEDLEYIQNLAAKASTKSASAVVVKREPAKSYSVTVLHINDTNAKARSFYAQFSGKTGKTTQAPSDAMCVVTFEDGTQESFFPYELEYLDETA